MLKPNRLAAFGLIGAIWFALGLVLIGCTQTPTPAAKTAPPWFTADPASCQLFDTNSMSRGDQYEYDSNGKNTNRFLPPGQVTCRLEIQICGDMVFRQQVINASEKCPPSLNFSYAPKTKVCCTLWNAAKTAKTPCDPMVDADCDGVPTMQDNWPLDYTRQ